MYDDHDKAALLALLTRFQRAHDAQAPDLKAKAEIDAKVAAHTAQMHKLQGAFSAFGLDVTKGFKCVWEIVGEEAYVAAVQRGGGALTSPSKHEAERLALAQAMNFVMDSKPGEVAKAAAEKPETTPQTVRDAVLEQLKAAGAHGTTASALRNAVERNRSTKLHDKTIGMTLYRLSQDRVARREGRTWFFVAETKNPGAGTPGPDNSQHVRKGGA